MNDVTLLLSAANDGMSEADFCPDLLGWSMANYSVWQDFSSMVSPTFAPSSIQCPEAQSFQPLSVAPDDANTKVF